MTLITDFHEASQTENICGNRPVQPHFLLLDKKNGQVMTFRRQTYQLRGVLRPYTECYYLNGETGFSILSFGGIRKINYTDIPEELFLASFVYEKKD